MGSSQHSGTSSITILLQDDGVDGLQINHNGGWVPVKPIPNSLVVNIGDVMEIWRNGKYKSIKHKAVTSGTKERISLATFVCPQMEVDIEPLKQMLDTPEQGRLYKKVNYGEYLMNSLGRKLEGKEYIADNASKEEM
ncbi:ACC oxidase [Heracleum sosnowskyi]|uniref:ACC oxidase n=1 Tax=Heracleum sosnowskyi TaxID=360622 RepID=A0AAD8M019_9APIA|nr:ACC oxidase [Heracleum sosnowskyi]